MWKLVFILTLLHSERPKLYGVLVVLSAVGLKPAVVVIRKKCFLSVYEISVVEPLAL